MTWWHYQFFKPQYERPAANYVANLEFVRLTRFQTQVVDPDAVAALEVFRPVAAHHARDLHVMAADLAVIESQVILPGAAKTHPLTSDQNFILRDVGALKAETRFWLRHHLSFAGYSA